MKLVLVLTLLLLVFVGGASASITWTGSSISVSGQSASMSEINATLDNSALLVEVSSKLWLLKVDMTIASDAILHINDTDTDELRLLSMNTTDAVFVSVSGSLQIDNTKITSWNTDTGTHAPKTDTYRARVRVRGASSKAKLENSEIAYLGASSQNGFELQLGSGESYIVKNCTVTDIKRFVTAESLYGATVAYIEYNNLTTSNTIVDVWLHNSIISHNILNNQVLLHCRNNLTVANNTVLDSVWNGMTFDGSKNSIAINNSVTGVYHDGMQLSSVAGTCPAKNCTFKNNEVYNMNDNAYYITWDGSTPSSKITDCLIEDCSAHDIPNARGLATDGAINITIRRYTSLNINSEDVQFYRSSTCYVVDSNIEDDIAVEYADGIKIINTKFSRISWTQSADMTMYYYMDILVEDESGNPVSGATVSVSHPNASIDWYGDGSLYTEIEVKSINLNTREITTPLMQSLLLDPVNIAQTTTGADGHTPVPSDEDNTLVIAEKRRDQHGSPWYEHPAQNTYFNSWNVTVTKDGCSNNTIVNPDSSWYRVSPDTYQNTTTIVLSGLGGTPTPTNLDHTNGTTWVNHTWAVGSGNVTDSYNVSINTVWHNTTTNAYYNNTGMSPETWSNITVWAWNSTYSELSSGSVSENTQSAAAAWSPSNTSMYYNISSVIEITTKTDGTNLFSRTPTQADGNATSCNLVVKTT